MLSCIVPMLGDLASIIEATSRWMWLSRTKVTLLAGLNKPGIDSRVMVMVA